MMGFEILSEIRDIETIAAGRGVGQVAWVQFPDDEIFMATGRQYMREDGQRSRWMRGCILYEEDFGG